MVLLNDSGLWEERMGVQAVMQKIEVVIPQDKLVRVLIIDDDTEFQGEMKAFFESYGCSVDVAKSPEEARAFLDSQTYEIVIADVNFDTSRVKGDRFVLDNERRLGNAQIVVVTGQGLDTINKFRALKRRGISIFDKSDNALDQNLETIAQVKFEERETKLLDSVRETISSNLGPSFAAAAAVKMARVTEKRFDPAPEQQGQLNQMLINWLSTRLQLDRRVLAYGASVLTPTEMIREIESDSEIGQAHMKLLISEIKHALRL